ERRSRRTVLGVEAMERLLVLSPTLPLPPPHAGGVVANFVHPPTPTPAGMGALLHTGSLVVNVEEPPDPCTVGPRFAPPDPC
ncbi:MAG TPA: hypothetical protein VN648_17175, partial [Candidatus Methylomirabilis sp.]|nr:hypothetical protein [Candidatus Methylomirabilis sp.]